MMIESEAAVETAGSEAGGNNIKTGRCGNDNEFAVLGNNIEIRSAVKTAESEDKQ